MAAIAISFAAGIVAATYVSLFACAAACIVAVVAAVLFGRGSARTNAAIAAGLFLLGAARYNIGCEVAANDISRLGYVSDFEGVVASDPDPESGRVRFVFRVDRASAQGSWRTASGNVMVSVYDESAPSLEYGDRVRFSARPYPPFEATNPGRFSWREYLSRQGIHTCASIRYAEDIHPLRGAKGSVLVRAAFRARHYLASSIARINPEQEASVIVGMVLGTYAYLPSETLRNFSRSGTLHLLAASGYNCWILLFLATLLLRPVRVTPKWRNMLVICLIIAYLLMTGAKPSMLRAAIMSCLLLLAVPLKRIPDKANMFFTAGFAILMIEPSDLFDVGFQLSFLAVWALIAVSPILASILCKAGLMPHGAEQIRKPQAAWLHGFFGGLVATGVATLSVSLITAPLVAYYFNYLSLTSVPANMAVEIGEPVIFAVGFAAPLVAHLGPLGDLVGWVGTWTTRGMLGVVNGLGSPKYAAVSLASPGLAAILGYYLLLYVAIAYARSRYAQR